MKKIYLNRDKRAFVLVDDENYEWLNSFSWMLGNHGYPYRQITKNQRTLATILMHRELLMAPDGFTVDHINRNKLDNRMSNLRVVTVKENVENRGLQSNNTSGYPGVRRNPSLTNPWQARVKYFGKEMAVGVFKTAEEAYSAKLNFLESLGG